VLGDRLLEQVKPTILMSKPSGIEIVFSMGTVIVIE
jgi:hypothetical protein